MMRITFSLLVIALLSGGFLPAAWQGPAPEPAAAVVSARETLNRYCVTCHNQKLKTAGVILDQADAEHVSANAEVWEKVIRKLRTRTMPPANAPRPAEATYDSLAKYLETEVDRAAAATPNPGRAAIHSLNRAEYTNAIRDLLGVEVDGKTLLPADDSGYGFDNIGDVLTVSPMLLGRYMSAARLISRLAIGDPSIQVSVSKYDVAKFGLQDERASEDLPFGSRGGIAIRHYFPLDGEYVIKIRLQKTNANYDVPNIFGLGRVHRLDVRMDGERVKSLTVGGERLKPEDVEAKLEVRFPVKAGAHTVGATFLDESLVPEDILRPLIVPQFQLWGWGPKSDGMRDPGIEGIAIVGPYNGKKPEETLSRKKIFLCYPTDVSVLKANEDCARKILSNLARRAYRRPVTEGDVDTLLGLYRDGRSHGGFETGIRMALQGMLVSSDFLFRIELDSPNARHDVAYRVSDIELASRLSFFLWSSIPDDELLNVAAREGLRNPSTLQKQVRRMLADPRSSALVDNFAGQWLFLRGIQSATPDSRTFPDFDENLREAFQSELKLFLGSMMSEDRSVVDLLNANYTFVNERLARHYGIPNVYGSRFRRITLTDDNRWGLLGKAGLLTVTSYPNRTSVVLRGKWVMETILGTPPPPPPPNVPALQENNDVQRLTMRQRTEQHRANPACAACHAKMDPLGFALENFDGIGKWRTTETIQSWNSQESAVTNSPIDASGVLPDGTAFQGPAELRKLLLSRPEQFVTTVTENLLTYALGRGLAFYDEPAVRKIVRESAAENYRWSAIIRGIVNSLPFQMRMSTTGSTASGLH